jgi:hypothetical protein
MPLLNKQRKLNMFVHRLTKKHYMSALFIKQAKAFCALNTPKNKGTNGSSGEQTKVIQRNLRLFMRN